MVFEFVPIGSQSWISKCVCVQMWARHYFVLTSDKLFFTEEQDKEEEQEKEDEPEVSVLTLRDMLGHVMILSHDHHMIPPANP